MDFSLFQPEGNKPPGSRRSSCEENNIAYFFVLLTVHLSKFILIINQLDEKNLFYNKFNSCL